MSVNKNKHAMTCFTIHFFGLLTQLIVQGFILPNAVFSLWQQSFLWAVFEQHKDMQLQKSWNFYLRL